MRGNELLDNMELVDPAYVEAAEVRRKPKHWIRWVASAACLVLVCAFTITSFFGNHNEGPNIQNPTTGDPDPTLSLEGFGGNGQVDLSYDKGYDSIEKLLDDAVLIVRATPVAIEAESDVAVCWVLRVTESNVEGLEVIRLRQMKDAHLLKAGQEVVLALQQDTGEGYYHIPGGGCGLFRVDEQTGELCGVLLESLKESALLIDYSSAAAELTLDDAYNILVGLSNP